MTLIARAQRSGPCACALLPVTLHLGVRYCSHSFGSVLRLWLLECAASATGDRRTASAHDGWEVDFDFMLEDGDDGVPASAEPGPSLAEVAASPIGAPSPGSSQYGSASEGAGFADEDMLEADNSEQPAQTAHVSRPAASGAAHVAALAADAPEASGPHVTPVGSPAGVARQLGDGLMLLRHPGTAINVPLTQVGGGGTDCHRVMTFRPSFVTAVTAAFERSPRQRVMKVCAQDPPAMTEDMQVEREAALASLGAPPSPCGFTASR